MKSALRARLSGPNWVDELPWVLLGIRTAPKEDLGCSSAELVYGSPLTVPGEFVANSGPQLDYNSQLQQLRDHVGTLAPVPTSQHGAAPVSVPADLQQAKFVFIRRDARHNSLQHPYHGPFRVIESGPKAFKVDVGGKAEIISVDRLKPAHLDVHSPVQLAQPPPRGRPPLMDSSPPPQPPTPQVQPSMPRVPQRVSIDAPIHPSAASFAPLPQYTRSGRLVRPNPRYISVLGGGVM